MEKDMMKKKFGLPPMPPIGPGAPARRNLKRKRDYTPVPWDKYFNSKLDVPLTDGDLINSSLSLSSDVGHVVSSLYQDDPPPIILVGHSMGGAIAVHTAARDLIPSLIGLAVIDVVEGTAMESLASMQSFLRGRPKTFDTMDKAIEWAVRSGQIQNVESAKVSMVGQLKRMDTQETGSEELEHQGSFDDIIEEEVDGEGEEEREPSSGSSSSAQTEFKSPSDGLQQTHKYTWRIDLSKTEKFWKGWFEGLSQKFLSCSPPKMLILAGPDRLDKDLTIGQMQGKFQMNLLPQCGHAVHEDVPDKVAEILANFMLRYRVTEAIGGFERSVPGC
ncbi:protein phosphatase methylesterase 1 isoform X2 [Aplysia californica]|uniref:Protein phosphatase methylesterase 1 n=1 Tax=Aplysia californica TaxID=6500 RepID=A0ABM1VWP3_APLCA|nr:protein phosphatase methylesterase 1 isoform X2 [Aplysia californica]